MKSLSRDLQILSNSQNRQKNKITGIEKYINNVEKEIAVLGKMVEVTKNELPEKVETAIKEIIKEEFKANRFNSYIAYDLFNAYISAGGKKLLVKVLKENPKNVLTLLKMIIDIGNAEANNAKLNQLNTQVVVNISGLEKSDKG